MKQLPMHLSRYRTAAALLCILAFLIGLYPVEAMAQQADYDPSYPQNLLPEHLSCSSAILVEAETGEVIFEKNADARIYPASTTKILTAYLGLLYNAENPDLQVTVSASAMDVGEGSSMIPLSFGETLRFEDLIYATVLRSGNEGANVIAETVRGSIPAFADMMNEAAESFGCVATHFTNPHGLHDENHYSTARDMSVIARAAMKDETFRDIVRRDRYEMPEDNIYKARTLYTNNRFMRNTADNAETYYPEGIGIKTGNTSAAGYCYIGAAKRKDVTLIACVFHARSDTARYTDTIKLLEYGFTQYTGISIAELYTRNPRVVDIAHYALTDSNLGRLTLALREIQADGDDKLVTSMSNIDYLAHHLNDITITEYTRAFSAPINEGEVMGTLTYYDSNGRPVVYELLATRSIARRPQLAPSIEDIIAYTDSDGNPFPRLTFEFVMLYIALPLLVIFLIVRFFHRLRHRKTRKKKRLRNIEPQERYFR